MTVRHPSSERPPEGPPPQHPPPLPSSYHPEHVPLPHGHHPYYPPPHHHAPPPPPPQADAGAPPPHHAGEPGQYPPPHYPPHYGWLHAPQYAPPGQQQKKKSNRASQACDRCRERKSKCDEKSPCSTCQEQNVPCVYRESQSAKGLDKGGTSLGEIQEIVQKIPDQNEQILDRLHKLENLLTSRALQDGVPTKEEEHRPDTPAEGTAKRETPRQHSQPLHRSQSAQEPLQQQAPPSRHERTDRDSPLTDEPLFDEHTTAAHKLLYLWPSIHSLFATQDQEGLHYNYVQNGEARGWLRLDGAGEAEKASELSAFKDETASFEPSPDNTPDMFSGMTALHDDPRRTDVISEAKKPDLREEIVWKYFHSYRRNIHALHPFLDMPTLASFVKTFIKRHSYLDPRCQSQESRSAGSTFTTANSDTAHRGVKRRRTDQHYTQQDGPRLSNERSLPVAITYLVLALGSICEWQYLVPGPLGEETHGTSLMPPPNVPYSASPPATSRLSPSSNYSGSTPGSTDARYHAHSPRVMYDSPGPGSGAPKRPRTNVEQIPGLDYYREACQILGMFADSNDVAVAQARLLAGLYKGQLGRVQESWSWIFDAARICRYQLRMEGLDRGSNNKEHNWKYPIESKRGIAQNTLVIVSWSALQLESDILAELDYPVSGCTDLQGSIPYPRETLRDGDYESNREYEQQQRTRLTESYNKQLYLRKRLNEMHSELYGKKLPSTTPKALASVLNQNLDTMMQFRSYQPWADTDPPAQNILDARLRAKSYGAEYICLRPYLDYVLHAMDHVQSGAHASEFARDPYGRERRNEVSLFAAMATMDPQVVQDRAQRCVKAAINSTTAFDGIQGKVIVTNIMGTSHAQFSNMLVLAAAYSSAKPYLQALISKKKLQGLFSRTVDFLSQLRHCNTTAVQDIRYLQMIHTRLFKSPVQEGQHECGWYTVHMTQGTISGGSFGSMMSE
ncbi:hypothetical protein CAC42_2976 [Sphaceloma murrayae]|uniref:Zn(2)-C6 fungal-type domain-containing protein n=1 Tax=Sphaceloma murrayae TaxID=2082308 RepID=A0A2K1R0A7_9PEZI|nr:hypothetical protein CAC42_2976 [Sphaceloma murrayae]